MAKKAQPVHRLQPQIPVPLYDALFDVTEKEEISMNQLVTRILTEWMNARMPAANHTFLTLVQNTGAESSAYLGPCTLVPLKAGERIEPGDMVLLEEGFAVNGRTKENMVTDSTELEG